MLCAQHLGNGLCPRVRFKSLKFCLLQILGPSYCTASRRGRKYILSQKMPILKTFLQNWGRVICLFKRAGDHGVIPCCVSPVKEDALAVGWSHLPLKEFKSSFPASQRYEQATVHHLFTLPVIHPFPPTPYTIEVVPSCSQNTKCMEPQKKRHLRELNSLRRSWWPRSAWVPNPTALVHILCESFPKE